MVMTSVNSSELGYVCDLDLSDFSGGNWGGEHLASGHTRSMKSFGLALPRQLQTGLKIQQIKELF